MKTIGIYDKDNIYVMDSIDIKGIIYNAKEIVAAPATEESLEDAWQEVRGAIDRRIAHERQRDGLAPKGEYWNFREGVI